MAESIIRKNIDLDILDYYDGKIKDYVDDKVGTGGLTVDDTLSDTSENPVQNKVIKQAISTKVDKISGKNLSTNDLTDALKNNYDAAYTHSQSAHAPSSAQANVIETVKVNNTALTPTNKTVNITVPSNTDRYVNKAVFVDDSTATTASPVKMTLTRAGSDTNTITANIPKVSSSSAGVVPKGSAVISQSKTTKFLREDGTWATPSYTTNTDTKVTAVGNHYTPTKSTTKSASGGTLTDITNSTSGTQVVTGVEMDAKGHVTGVTSVALKSTDTKVTVDSALSSTSTNPVQNKVVKQEIDNKADKTTATTDTDGLMSAEDKSKLDNADDTYALKSIYDDSTLNLGRRVNSEVGQYSVVIGRNLSATKQGAVAEGMDNTASGYYSHAEGSGTTASGYNSHSEGWLTTASGAHSHAGGRNSKTEGYASFAHGYYVNAFSGTDKNAGHAAFGMYNLATTDTLFSIGDGTADDARHNAFEITTTGGKLHDVDIATTNVLQNPNLLINPDFKINQRGKTGTIIPNKNAYGEDIHTYFVDRWGIDSGSVTINSDGTLTLNGTISQILETPINIDTYRVIPSVSSGTIKCLVDASTNMIVRVAITAENEIISWAKLEYGNIITPFILPNPVEELKKCLRYYENITGAVGSGYFYSTTNCIVTMSTNPKRTLPTATINGNIVAWAQEKVASNGIDIVAISIDGYHGNAVNIRANFTFTTPSSIVYVPCFVEVRSGVLILDAELY